LRCTAFIAAVQRKPSGLSTHPCRTAKDAPPRTIFKMGANLSIRPISLSQTLSRQAALSSRRILAELRKIFAIHKHIASIALRSYPPKDVEI
jgi:hypothetical protein